MGEWGCTQFITLCHFFLLTVLPCSSMGCLPWAMICTTFSNVAPSRKLRVFKNLSSMDPFHRAQSFRHGLLQHWSPAESQSCQKTHSWMGFSPWATVPARSLLQHMLSKRSQLPSSHIYLLWWWGPPWAKGQISALS